MGQIYHVRTSDISHLGRERVILGHLEFIDVLDNGKQSFYS
jgi:hypothetical protein